MVRDVRPGFSRPSEMSAPAWAWNVGGLLVNHWTAFLQWPCRATQGGLGGREAGRQGQRQGPPTGPANVFCLITTHSDKQGGEIAKIICNLLLVLIWRMNLKFLFRTSGSGPQQQQSWFSINAPASQEHHMMLLHAVSPFSAFCSSFRWGGLQATSPRRRSSVGVHILCHVP